MRFNPFSASAKGKNLLVVKRFTPNGSWAFVLDPFRWEEKDRLHEANSTVRPVKFAHTLEK